MPKYDGSLFLFSDQTHLNKDGKCNRHPGALPFQGST